MSWALWVVWWGLCGLSLLPTDVIRSHQIDIWGVWELDEHLSTYASHELPLKGTHLTDTNCLMSQFGSDFALMH